jgi:hypothetical protein
MNWQRKVQCRAPSGKASQDTLSGDAWNSSPKLVVLMIEEGQNKLTGAVRK